jgi:hypothetical protein
VVGGGAVLPPPSWGLPSSVGVDDGSMARSMWEVYHARLSARRASFFG